MCSLKNAGPRPRDWLAKSQFRTPFLHCVVMFSPCDH